MVAATIDTREYKAYLERRTRPNTALTYIHGVESWFRWLNGREPDQRSAQDYIDYLENQGKSRNTVNTHANAIKRYFKFLKMPVALEAPGVQLQEPTYITVEELEGLLSSCKTLIEQVIIVVLFDTACRISEILGLRLDGIDWDNELLYVERKGGRREWVNVSNKALPLLRAWLDSRTSVSEMVFDNLDYQGALAMIKDVGKRAGIVIRPHMFRHSRAVQMLLAGAEPAIIQQTLGHIDLATTMKIYARLKPIHLKGRIPSW